MIYISYRAIFDLKALGTKLSKGGGGCNTYRSLGNLASRDSDDVCGYH